MPRGTCWHQLLPDSSLMLCNLGTRARAPSPLDIKHCFLGAAVASSGIDTCTLRHRFAEVKSTLLEGVDLAASQPLVFLSDQLLNSVSPQASARIRKHGRS